MGPRNAVPGWGDACGLRHWGLRWSSLWGHEALSSVCMCACARARARVPRLCRARSRAVLRKAFKMTTVASPKHSPALNPLDYFVWAEVNRRMGSQSAPANESQTAYKSRLRQTAMSIPAPAIRVAVGKMKAEAAEVVQSKGGRIPSDWRARTGRSRPPLGCLALPEHDLCVSADIRQHTRRACMFAVFSADAPSGRGVFCLSRPVCARRLSPPGRLVAFPASAQN